MVQLANEGGDGARLVVMRCQSAICVLLLPFIDGVTTARAHNAFVNLLITI